MATYPSAEYIILSVPTPPQDEMFGTPERDEADEDCSDLEDLEDEGDEELAELQHEDGAEVNKPSDKQDLEDDGGAELEELEHEDGAEVYKPSEGQELAQGPAEEEEEWADSLPVSPGEDFDPDECAANVSPAGVAEICSSPEKAETQEDLHAKDRASELRDRLRELKKKWSSSVRTRSWCHRISWIELRRR